MSVPYSKRNYLYHIEPIEDKTYMVVPGKFSLAFSLAVNTFHRLIGHYPNTYVMYNTNLDVSKWVGVMRHKSIVSSTVTN
jgi:hypothetical protein